MTAVWRLALPWLLVTVLAAGGGGWLGVRYGLAQSRSSTSLDQLLHHELDLTTAQRGQLAALEGSYAIQRRGLEAQARAANRDLARAILSEHRYGPDAQQAIEHFHGAMEMLEQRTIQHVLAMRAVLTPQQAARFDQTIAGALTSDDP
ncbi:MAG TPA: periplasmic heavy metal sensor [Solirubrobacteraceae bacterium]|nr:periplasmic heavy metal sensor [Solirubrobacteraceae bacterium]